LETTRRTRPSGNRFRFRGEEDTSQSDEKLWFATRNKRKFQEAKAILANRGVKVHHLSKAKTELQSSNLQEIASFAANSLSKNQPGIVAVEDSGLFVRALEGFPGPYTAYVYRTIRPSGVLKLLKGRRERAAFFLASVAAAKSGRTCKVFTGRVPGSIAWREKGRNGFGFDPIFIPQGERMTYGEMDENRKNIFSHRHEAFRKLAEWYLSR